MRKSQLVFSIALGLAVLQCTNKTEKKMETISVTISHEVPEMTLEGELTYHFSSINEWLIDLCVGNTLPVSVEHLKFDMYQQDDRYLVYLAGINTDTTGNTYRDNVVFEPKHMYYQLSASECKDLAFKQAYQFTQDVLINFCQSPKFKQSYLASSTPIFFSGEELWPTNKLTR